MKRSALPFLLIVAAVWMAFPVGIRGADAADSPFWTPEEVAAYKPKGPTRCFRHLCYDYNWPGRTLSDIPLKFTEADPVALAEFSQKINLDAVLLLAVPHHGYCTYNTKIGVKFPGMKGDWFGQCVRELHKRNISAFGYVTLGTNWKYMRDNLDKPFIHGRMDAKGVIEPIDAICFNAPGYLELVEGYTREVLTNYPVDAMRYDMCFSAKKCLCDGCKKFYRELYHEELTDWETAKKKDPRRAMDFYLATLDRAVTRLTKTSREVKPSVEIWQNHVNTYSEADVNLGRLGDIAYIEFGDPMRLLAMRGIIDKPGIIVGQTLASPIRRLIMALGARCYQYMPVNQKTALPDRREWYEKDLAPFFNMVSQVQSYLEGATLPSHIGLVYSENTRYRYPNYDRAPYMGVCNQIADAYLKRSMPLRYVNCLDLPQTDLTPFRLLVLPTTSGLKPQELEALRGYVRGGGNLLVLGDALRHDEKGFPRADFALATEMGLHFAGLENLKKNTPVALDIDAAWSGDVLPKQVKGTTLVEVKPVKGDTLLRAKADGNTLPLLHVNKSGKGRVAFLATSDSPDLTRLVMDDLAGPAPLSVSPEKNQVVLARQEKHSRWILHLISGGDYTVVLRPEMCAAARIAEKFPAEGWDARIEKNDGLLRIEVSGEAKDRLLVLE